MKRVRRYSDIWLLAACLCLALALRFFRIDAQSLWFDEGISAFQLHRDFAEIVRAAAGDTHPPLYYWTLKVWTAVFGSSELGLRSLSAVSGVGVVGLTWLLGRRLFGAGPATVGALLLAISPLAVYYSQEVRMYSLVALFALLAVYLGIRWLDGKTANWSVSLSLYVLAAAATLYTQYLGALLLVALNVYVLARLAVRNRSQLVTWLLAQAAVVLLFAPWLPVLLDQSQHRALNTSSRTLPNLLVQTATALTLGRDAEASWMQPAVAVLWCLAVLGVASGLRRQGAATLLVLLTLVPACAVITLGVTSGLFELRYLTLALPGLTLLVGLGATQLWRLRPRLVTALATTVALGLLLTSTSSALARTYFDPATFRDDYRGAVQFIQEHARPGDAIVLNAGNQWDPFSYYYRGEAPVYLLPTRRPIDLDDTRRRLEEIQQGSERVWMLLWASREGDPEGFIEQWFTRNAYQSSHAWYQTIQLLLFSFAQPGGEPGQRLDTRLSNGAQLLGYTLSSEILQPGETLGLTLFWRAEAVIPERFKVFTHLLNGTQQVVAQRDSEPVGGLRPTTTWEPGENVVDNYGILLPHDLPPGRYQLEVGMYRPSDGVRPTFADAGGSVIGDHLIVAQVEIR